MAEPLDILLDFWKQNNSKILPGSATFELLTMSPQVQQEEFKRLQEINVKALEDSQKQIIELKKLNGDLSNTIQKQNERLLFLNVEHSNFLQEIKDQQARIDHYTTELEKCAASAEVLDLTDEDLKSIGDWTLETERKQVAEMDKTIRDLRKKVDELTEALQISDKQWDDFALKLTQTSSPPDQQTLFWTRYSEKLQSHLDALHDELSKMKIQLYECQKVSKK